MRAKDWRTAARYAVYVVGGGFLLLSLIALTLEPSKEEATGPRVGTISEEAKATEALGVRVKGGVRTNHVYQNAELPIWASVENHSSGTIQITEFRILDDQGFQNKESSKLPLDVATGGSTVLQDSEHAVASSGRYWLVAVVQFQAAKQTYRRLLTLGPVEVTDWWRETLLPLNRAQGFILPATLALLTLVVQQSLAKRAELNAVWKDLLPQFMERTERYYMPLSRASDDVLSSAEALRTSQTPKNLRLAFFHFMVFLYCRRTLKEKIGGITFKNRDGERLTAICLERILKQTDQKLDLKARDVVLDQMKSNENYHRFEGKFTGSIYGPTFVVLETQVDSWITGKDYPALSRALKVLSFTMDTEVNRPLEKWYEKPEVLENKVVNEMLTELSTDNELHPLFKKYTDRLLI
ncbi:MAG TPA: hypothetical protein VHZ07_10325 [Bryobacteraceae bacterium]|jgi:hypothetical protein|nr:hypothetical protein [Bryobacteraceae bacterium]